MARLRIRWSLAAIGVAALVPAVAGANVVFNGDFELGTLPWGVNPSNQPGAAQLLPGDTRLTGWTIGEHDVAPIRNGNTWGMVAESGLVFVDITGWWDRAPSGSLSQVIATQPGTLYDLEFSFGTTIGRTGQMVVSLGADSHTVTKPASSAYWSRHAVRFQASGSQSVLRFYSMANSNDQSLDRISMVAVPEPGAMAALGAGLALLVLRRRPR